MGRFEWGELFSLIAVIISFITIMTSLYGGSKTDTRNEQRMFDKLDRLNDMSEETRDNVRDISAKVDGHGERLVRVENDIENLYRRMSRIEKTCDAHLGHHPEGTD